MEWQDSESTKQIWRELGIALQYNNLQVATMGKKRTVYKKQEIPFFISKLISILDDLANKQIIEWSDSGRGFVIRNEPQLIRKLLPQHFKHHNLASFIRQLNLYGFHKIENAYQYSHEHFCRADPEQFKLIKRVVKIKKKRQPMVKRKEQKVILASQCQQLDKLELENEKLRQQNKVLMREKTENLRILRKLKTCARKSKKQIENAIQKQSKYQKSGGGQQDMDQEISQERVVESQQNLVDPYKDGLYSEEVADELLNSYLS